jgi:hypothetical protein
MDGRDLGNAIAGFYKAIFGLMLGGGLVVALAVGFIVFAITSSGTSLDDERNKAIEAGVGRWVIDSKTGDRKFVYGKE